MTMNNRPDHKPNFFHLASLGSGLLSIWPYFLVWIGPLLLKIETAKEILGPVIGVSALFIAPCNGIPFGISGIILGIFAFAKTASVPQKTIVISIAVIGILISISGCISNVWYFSNLVPWSSVPPQ